MMPSDRPYADSYAYKPVATENPDGGLAAASAPLVENGKSDEPSRSGCAGECAGYAGIFIAPLNVLLVFVPIGVYSSLKHWSSGAIFTTNFLAIIPLARILGDATESLAVHTGQMIGGLLNATFGNAVEMIVTINAIKAGLISVVQGSLLGSILSNLLLVLGMSFFAAGVIKEKESQFSAQGASANMSCLSLGSIGLALPTIFDHMPLTSQEAVLHISRISSVVIAGVYVLFLVFQLKTHAYLFGGDDEEEEEAPLSICGSVFVLIIATICVAVNSEFLVDSIEGVTEEYGLPKAFIGVILLPIVGNAAEHTTAVTVAAKGKMDLALGVAVGSSTQIALLVVPFSVIVGWIYDVPMSLDFRVFDSTVFMLAVFLASGVLQDGSSNWLEGAMLMATYLLIAIICWYIPDETG